MAIVRASCFLAGLGVLATYLLAPLNDNLRYEAGVKMVGEGTAANLFSHRPLAYRMVMDQIFRPAHGMAMLGPDPVAGFEVAVRVLLMVLAVAAGTVLWLGLRRHGDAAAGSTAVVLVGSLVLLGPVSAGEPEWLATLLTAAGVGAALLGSRRSGSVSRVCAVVAGTLLVGAAGMKILTLALVPLALGAVWRDDRRQAVRTAVGFVVVGVAYAVLTVAAVPWELQWLADIRSVQNDGWAGLASAPSYAVSLVAERPVLLLLPAAFVLAGRRARTALAAAVAVTAALVVLQGQYFDYHAIPLVTVAAVAVLRLLRGRVGPAEGVALLVVVAATTVLGTATEAWRVDHERATAALLAVVAVAGVGWALRLRRPQDPSAAGATGPTAAVVVTLALLYPGATPWAADLLRPVEPGGYRPLTTLEQRSRHEASARAVHRVVGGDRVQVTYLTPGMWTYFVGNPTTCHYPSPLFLQRTRKPLRLTTASFAENVGCLSARGSRWLVVDPNWFRVQPQPLAVKRILAREWNCGASVTVTDLRLCPRRTG